MTGVKPRYQIGAGICWYKPKSIIMAFSFKMVFCLIPLTAVMLVGAVVVTAYMLANYRKLSKSVILDNEVFMEG